MKTPPSVLSVAGSDPSGGAGIQADMKVAALLGVHGAAVPSLLTVQDSRRVHSSHPVDPALFREMLSALLLDLNLSSVKIGALRGIENVETLIELLSEYEAARAHPLPIVLDPIFRSSSGSPFLDEAELRALEERLFPRLALLTPNLIEARALLGDESATQEEAAHGLYARYGAPVLVKGGHAEGAPIDLLVDGEGMTLFQGERIEGDAPRGTGCALSMAIASKLAKGSTLRVAIERSKDFVARAIKGAFRPGGGVSFLNLRSRS